MWGKHGHSCTGVTHTTKAFVKRTILFLQWVYAINGLFLFLELPLQTPFYWGKGDNLTTLLSCGSVYLLVWLALGIAWFVIYVLVARGYHKRERGNTKRQQDYPEEYYSKYLRSRRQWMYNSLLCGSILYHALPWIYAPRFYIHIDVCIYHGYCNVLTRVLKMYHCKNEIAPFKTLLSSDLQPCTLKLYIHNYCYQSCW